MRDRRNIRLDLRPAEHKMVRLAAALCDRTAAAYVRETVLAAAKAETERAALSIPGMPTKAARAS